jgi:hypothetical protein
MSEPCHLLYRIIPGSLIDAAAGCNPENSIGVFKNLKNVIASCVSIEHVDFAPEAVKATQSPVCRQPDPPQSIFGDSPNIVAAQSVADAREVPPLEVLLSEYTGRRKKNDEKTEH